MDEKAVTPQAVHSELTNRVLGLAQTISKVSAGTVAITPSEETVGFLEDLLENLYILTTVFRQDLEERGYSNLLEIFDDFRTMPAAHFVEKWGGLVAAVYEKGSVRKRKYMFFQGLRKIPEEIDDAKLAGIRVFPQMAHMFALAEAIVDVAVDLGMLQIRRVKRPALLRREMNVNKDGS